MDKITLMHWLPYTIAFLSGMVYGLLELFIAHRRLKREAITNLWGIVYIFGMSFLALMIFVLVEGRSQALFNFSSNQVVNELLSAILAGPLTNFLMKYIGGRSKVSKELISYHDRVFRFLEEEIKQIVNVSNYTGGQ